MSEVEHWALANGVKVPAIGFGVGSSWRVKKLSLKVEAEHVMPELVECVENALKAGFTHVDSAEIYLTRQEMKLGFQNSGIPRDQLFITDKHFCGAPSFPAFTDSPYASIEKVLRELDTAYIDLYLLHSSKRHYPEGAKQLSIAEQWQDLERAYKEGKVRAIGVSNYSAEDIEKILQVAEIKPQALQIEYHALCQNKTPGIKAFCQKHGIQLFAYAPLAPITLVKEKNVLSKLLAELAAKYGKTEAQVLLRWVAQSGVVPITTSGKIQRLKDAISIYSFKLDTEDFEAITKLGEQLKQTFYNW